MKLYPIDFVENIHYEELSPEDGKNKYRYRTKKPIIGFWDDVVKSDIKISFRDRNHREWLYMDEKHFIIHKCYAWDGCTPKRHLPVFGWVGTPDFEETILPSLIHDVFCQYINTHHFPFDESVNNKIFKNYLKMNDFKYTTPYYLGVSAWSFINLNDNEGNISSILSKSDK